MKDINVNINTVPNTINVTEYFNSFLIIYSLIHVNVILKYNMLW